MAHRHTQAWTHTHSMCECPCIWAHIYTVSTTQLCTCVYVRLYTVSTTQLCTCVFVRSCLNSHTHDKRTSATITSPDTEQPVLMFCTPVTPLPSHTHTHSGSDYRWNHSVLSCFASSPFLLPSKALRTECQVLSSCPVPRAPFSHRSRTSRSAPSQSLG